MRGPMSSHQAINSAMNTPTIASMRSTSDGSHIDPEDALDAIADDMESVVSASDYGGHSFSHQASHSATQSLLDLNLGSLMETETAPKPNKICGINYKYIARLNRDEVYDQRSVILYELGALAKAFVKKMGKEFCLNAAGTKILFVAGLQDKGCTLDEEQLNMIYHGVEQFLPVTEYDLPHAVATWITKDETEEDCTSLELRSSEEWNVTKSELPTYLKHE